MATYPDVLQVIGSVEQPDAGTEIDRAVSGKPRLRTYFSQTWTGFRIIHECDTPDKETLMTFYETNKYDTNTFQWKGDMQNYTVRFKGSPQPRSIRGTGRWRITVDLIAV